jgi:hypothetical protein
LEFEECSGGRDDEGDATDDGGDYPSAALTCSLEKILHRVRAFAPNELIELADNFPADGLRTEDHTRDRGCDEQDWRDRKQRVVGERRAEARGIVVPPGSKCGAEY